MTPLRPDKQRYVVLWTPKRDRLTDPQPKTQLWSPVRMRFTQAVKQVDRLTKSFRTKGDFTVGELP